MAPGFPLRSFFMKNWRLFGFRTDIQRGQTMIPVTSSECTELIVDFKEIVRAMGRRFRQETERGLLRLILHSVDPHREYRLLVMRLKRR
jgi:hypothetical protein